MLTLQVTQRVYEKKPDAELIVEFERDRITLDVPMEGISIPNGWKILPITPPVVSLQNNSGQAFMSEPEYN